ncbi:MAG: hypothetical protein R3B57_09845 [Phycisphaerales bacterium]
MTLRRHKLILAWLLVLTHLGASVAGATQPVVCRQADGGSHVEWVIERCCPGELADEERATASEEIAPRDAKSCPAGRCEAEPLSPGYLILNSRSSWSQLWQIAAAIEQVSIEAGEWRSPPISPHSRDWGPPRHLALALRAAILLL